jgi:hypothetical protein
MSSSWAQNNDIKCRQYSPWDYMGFTRSPAYNPFGHVVVNALDKSSVSVLFWILTDWNSTVEWWTRNSLLPWLLVCGLFLQLSDDIYCGRFSVRWSWTEIKIREPHNWLHCSIDSKLEFIIDSHCCRGNRARFMWMNTKNKFEKSRHRISLSPQPKCSVWNIFFHSTVLQPLRGEHYLSLLGG